ncbi:MAG TPA: hypothetical protein VEW67_03945 [Thermoleophilaceae bacterium]|nr:hypothetical protein [Thermoleophilaceae bacterium]
MLKFLRSLPLPLVLAFVAAIVTRVALEVGGDPLDPFWAALTALAVALAAGLSTTDSVVAVLRTLDSKLVSTVVTTGLTYLAVELVDFAENDPLLQAFVSLVAGSIVGYRWPNAGTVLRTEHDPGSPPLDEVREQLGGIKG